ncbi:MAG: transporter, ATP-binding protein, partial [Bacillota bacterium]|nr:transporter, ATP-binding protein [Bacillota bacterium]
MIKIFKRLKPFSLSIIGVIFFVLLQSLCDLYIPKLMADIVNDGILNNNINYVLTTGIKMLLFTFGIILFGIITGFLSSIITAKFSAELRRDIFTKVENFSLDEFNKFGTSSMITRTTNDVNQIQQVVLVILRMMVMAPIMAVGGTIMAVKTDIGLSWVFGVSLPTIVFILGIIILFAGKLFSSMQSKLDSLNLVMRENLTGMRVIRAFDRINYEINRFKISNDDLTETSIKANKIMSILMPGIMLVLNFTTILIVWFGAKRINIGAMKVGSLMAYTQYAAMILFSFVMLSMLFVMIPRALASAKRINEILETEPSIIDTDKPEILNCNNRGELEFKNVTFAYAGAEEAVLKNINFKASKGEVTAIVGGTGSGKSTLINLIPRFYEVTEGEIMVDGINIKNMIQHDLRNKIGIVPQKAILFSGTVKENIKYGKEDATDEEIKYAADIACASEFINEMEAGFDTVISQGGKNISGGQKQ